MHPFLKSPIHVLVTGLFWSPLVFFSAWLEHGLTGLSLKESIILTGPALLLLLLVVVSLWYPYKILSRKKSDLFRFLLNHVLLAIVLLSMWLLITGLYSVLLDVFSKSEQWYDHFNEMFPLFLGLGLLLYFLSVLVYSLILALEKSRESEQKALISHLETSQAELDSLKASIHPHFLFNSLTALSTLIQTSPEKAHRLCLQLSDFLRYSLDYGRQNWVHIKDELDHIQNYLAIEKSRLGDKLSLDLKVEPQALEVEIPPFTLLPLVENAVKHGFQPSLDSKTLFLRIKTDTDWISIDVKNTYDPLFSKPRRSGYGLKGLKKRLVNVYNDDSTMLVKKENNVFSVEIRLPKKPSVSQ